MKNYIFTTIAAGLLSLGLASQSAMANSTGEVVAVNKDFASPVISLSGYSKVYIQDLDLSEAKIISPPWIEKDSFDWNTTEKNLAFLKARFKEGVTKGLTENNGRYEVVEELGKGVLILDVEIISFMPYVNRADETSETKGSGEFHLSVQLRDGKTYSLIHITEGTQVIGDEYQPNTDMTRATNEKALFEGWGKVLRKALDDAK